MENYPTGVNMDLVLGGPHDILCECHDEECWGMGRQGNVRGHIENCPCGKCLDNQD